MREGGKLCGTSSEGYGWVRRTDALALGLFVAALGATTSFCSAADGPSDGWLATTAKIAILTSLEARGSSVQVDAMNATITLYGKVSSAADKKNVEKLARSVEGVREVRNLLMIAPVAVDNAPAIPDSELHNEVAIALITESVKKDGPLSRSHVFVQSVDNGTVLLTGTANSLAAHLLAIKTARGVRGIRAVRSNVQSSDARAVYQARFLGW
jgi:hyperosmotically inducible periplasmic protein